MRSTLWMLVFGLALPLFAHAEPVRQVVPYSGRLDLDGAPYTGDAQMRFRFYTAPDVAVAEDCAAEDACAWEELHDGVQVFNGTFAVDLGTSDPALMAQVVAQNTQYWLEMAVRRVAPDGEEPPPWVTLASRQAIRPAPQTLWSAQASDFRVTGTLAAEGDVEVAGNATVGGTLAGEGDVTVAGQLHLLEFGDVPARRPVQDRDGAIVIGPKDGLNMRISGNEIVAVNNGANATLSLNPGGPIVANGGTMTLREATLSAGLTVAGTLTANGAATVGGTLTANGATNLNGNTTIATLQPAGYYSAACPNANCDPFNGADASAHRSLGPSSANHICFLMTFNDDAQAGSAAIVHIREGRWWLGVSNAQFAEMGCFKFRP